MKVALVCDWLTTPGGAEKVLLQLHRMYPDAPIYTSQYRPKGIDWFRDADVRTGWLNLFPASLRRFLGVLRQFYFSHLDLSDYDLVISVTGAEAKSVRQVQIVFISVIATFPRSIIGNFTTNISKIPVLAFLIRLLALVSKSSLNLYAKPTIAPPSDLTNLSPFLAMLPTKSKSIIIAMPKWFFHRSTNKNSLPRSPKSVPVS